ncbi:MAG TPA: hypothetical protein VJ991_04970 [Balneolales bacterium]|nr:hypothetical protein [Balneolales bacterium]
MNLENLLKAKADKIISDSETILEKSHIHQYDKVGKTTYHNYLKKIFTLTLQCIESKSLLPISEYAEKIAKERYEAGFDLYEVQHAINILEETLWMAIINDLNPEEYEEALRLTSTILGAGKEALAGTYVSLASNNKAPVRDIEALFKGTDGV